MRCSLEAGCEVVPCLWPHRHTGGAAGAGAGAEGGEGGRAARRRAGRVPCAAGPGRIALSLRVNPRRLGKELVVHFGRGCAGCSLAYRGGVQQRYKFPVTEAFCPFRRGLLFKGKQQLKFTVLLFLLFLAANVAA